MVTITVAEKELHHFSKLRDLNLKNHQYLLNLSQVRQLLSIYLLSEFAGHRVYEIGDVNSYMNISGKDEHTALTHRIDRFSKSDLQLRGLGILV